MALPSKLSSLWHSGHRPSNNLMMSWGPFRILLSYSRWLHSEQVTVCGKRTSPIPYEWHDLNSYSRRANLLRRARAFKDLTGIICLKSYRTPCIHLQRLSWHDKHTLIGKKFFVTYDDISVRYKGENGEMVNENIDVEEDCLLCKIDEAS